MTTAGSRATAPGALAPAAPEIRRSAGLVQYPGALAAMEERAAAIRAGTAPELIWLLEHPALLTAGTSARPEDLLQPDRLPVFQAGRGGQFTYHGPGQRVVYAMLDLQRRGPDLRAYIWQLEEWLIRTLRPFGVAGLRRPGRVGIWVIKPDGGEAKIGAIGVRVRRWVSLHGLSLNVAPALDHFTAIVPCGIQEFGVTSLADLGIAASMDEVDEALLAAFAEVFAGPTTLAQTVGS